MARPASAVRRRCCRREPAASASCHDPPELSCARLSQHPSSHSTPLYNTAVPLRGSDAPPQRTHVSLYFSRRGTKPFPHITFPYILPREQAALLASCCDNPEPSCNTRHPSAHSLSLENTIVQLRGFDAPPQTYTRPLPSRAVVPTRALSSHFSLSLAHPADGSAVGCDRRSVAQEWPHNLIVQILAQTCAYKSPPFPQSVRPAPLCPPCTHA